eukprot:gene2635-5171_t
MKRLYFKNILQHLYWTDIEDEKTRNSLNNHRLIRNVLILFILTLSAIHLCTTLHQTSLEFANLRGNGNAIDNINYQYYRRGTSKGIVMCAAEFMVPDVQAVIHQIIHIWKSKLPIAIFHCNELSNSSISLLEQVPMLSIYDLCIDKYEELKCNKSRLQGFFCKPAALLYSPFQENILIDTDIIWFNNPDKLFDAPIYHKTGTIFFRDRFQYQYQGQPISSINQITMKEFFFQENSIEISSEYAKKLFHNNGISFIWKSFIDSKYKSLQHAQDSSVVVFDKSRHKKTLSIIKHLLSNFSIGYGDKEIYWIAATLAQEPFSFEPFLFAIYGDCGALIHYNPNDKYSLFPKPFYMNAEYLLECLTYLGENTEDFISKPVLVNKNTPLFTLGHTDKITHGLCGACTKIGCISTPNDVNKYIKLAQEEHLNRSHYVHKTTKCMIKRQQASVYKPFKVIEDSSFSQTPKEVLEEIERIRLKANLISIVN